jgi:transcriptional regulator with PAS, ATPase and Fis domain
MNMEQPIVHILGIAPYEGIKASMERAAVAFPNIQLDVYTGDLEEGAAIVQKNQYNSYDCIISRGGTAEMIRRITDTPVVEIPLSVYDVLRTIKLAENYSNLYAIVGFPSITEPAHTLCDLLHYNIDIITVHNTDEVYSTLTRIKEKNYRMVVCDMATHTIARQMGLDAFLITSGMESLHTAFEQALTLSAGFRRLRLENLFLRSIIRNENEYMVVLDKNGTLYYSSPTTPPEELLALLRSKIPEVPSNTPLKFYHNDQNQLYNVTAQVITMGQTKYYLFYYLASQIPLRSYKSGIRSFSKNECNHLFMNSFYSISGAMGELESAVTAVSATHQPVMIIGEPGTGKEQIARALYLRGPLCNKPFIAIDCALIIDKSWDYLLNHYNSPLNDSGNTIYFHNFERLPAEHWSELLSAILETGLYNRERLLFSCNCMEGTALPEAALLFTTRLGCLTLRLPTLRSRSDEIPSLAALYLSSLNLELGKQISGFDSNAIELLRHYEWPNNYTQFKQILYELATLANSSYIRSSSVAELLAKERSLTHSSLQKSKSSTEGRTLEQIIYDVIQQTLIAHNGNQSAAAKQLGISRTTMWRHLSNAARSDQNNN